MIQLVFFLEERSVEALLKILLPRIIGSSVDSRYIVFEGKQDLEKQLIRRMQGYRTPGARFVVLRDQDAGKCKEIKASLKRKCEQAGRSDAVVRIACHELESWYLGDLAAVERGLSLSGLRRLQNSSPYRTPDKIVNPSAKLARIAKAYQKIGGSRAIGPYLDVDNVRSCSFGHFVKSIRNLAAQ
ncbi:MAG: DUF4276 family protein [Deltaproteobacteria bacterium]|nr:DUF4276 family protein [Deltaproteobacteria bacterium]